MDQAILAPTDPTDTTGNFKTVITGRDIFSDLGGVGNEVTISSLLNTIQETEELDCDCANKTLEECTHQTCTRKVLVNYISRYLSDLDGDGKITCDDAAILLYVGHEFRGPPIRIHCSLFWSMYRRNVGFLKHSIGLDINSLEIITSVGEQRTQNIEEYKESLHPLNQEFLCAERDNASSGVMVLEL